MNTCPYCGAEIRPGDRFCLNCGKPLMVTQQPAPPTEDEATMLGSPLPLPNSWSVANSGSDDSSDSSSSSASSSPGTYGSPDDQQQGISYEGATMMAPANARTIENPGRFVLTSYKGKEVPNSTSYGLDKPTTTIGRAPENDIVLLDEEKVISRYHATLRYSGGSYSLIDNGSSNGTNVNGQSVDKQAPRALQDGDRVNIGDYELIYFAPISVSSEATMVGISPAPNFETVPFGDQQREPEEGQTATWNWQQNADLQGQQAQPTQQEHLQHLGQQEQMANEQSASAVYASQYVQQHEQPYAQEYVASSFPQGNDVLQQGAIAGQSHESVAEPLSPQPSVLAPDSQGGVTVQRFRNLAHPLPDIGGLMSAVAALNNQISALQGRLDVANEATQNHHTELTETAQQLRGDMSQVSNRMNSLINDGSQSREAVHWDQLQTLLQDVIRNPRDIDNARAFADRASDMNMILQKYDALLNGLAECTNQLRTLIGEE